MNIPPNSIMPPAAKDTYARVEPHLENKNFDSLLFSAELELANDSAPVNKSTDVLDETLLLSMGCLQKNNTEVFSGVESHNRYEVAVVKSDRLERKELHEQKLMANYALSYVDLIHETETAYVAAANSPEPHFLASKSQPQVLVGSELSLMFKINQSSVMARPSLLNNGSIYSEEIAMSSALVSQRHVHSDIIARSKVVVGGQANTVSLYVRDHFSNKNTLTAVVADILSRLKSVINEVIINGKRG